MENNFELENIVEKNKELEKENNNLKNTINILTIEKDLQLEKYKKLKNSCDKIYSLLLAKCASDERYSDILVGMFGEDFLEQKRLSKEYMLKK